MPVVLEDYPCSSIKESLIDEECIHIAWIGRLSRDKIYALINLMNHLEKIKIIKKFHIIGEGNCKHLLREYRFETIYLGTISPKDLPSYLQTHIDIVFAMGTSMLEAEKCGIPAVYTFYSWEEYSRDCFVWAFKLKNYCLGYKWEDRLVSDEKLMSLEQILNDFLVNMPHCSKEAREHFESFLIHKHIDRFLACVDETSYSNEVLRKEKSKTKLERLKFKLIKKLRFYKLREDRI